MSKFLKSFEVIYIKTLYYLTRSVKVGKRKLPKGEVVQIVGMSFCEDEQSYLVEVLKTGERVRIKDFTMHSSSYEFEVPMNSSLSEIYSISNTLSKKEVRVLELEYIVIAVLFIIAICLHNLFSLWGVL